MNFVCLKPTSKDGKPAALLLMSILQLLCSYTCIGQGLDTRLPLALMDVEEQRRLWHNVLLMCDVYVVIIVLAFPVAIYVQFCKFSSLV